MKKKLTIIPILLIMLSCSNDSNIMVSNIPSSFKMIGSANGQILVNNSQNIKNIDCLCDQIIELQEGFEKKGDTIIYKGTMGGFFQRTALNEDGSGISLTPDTFSQIIIKVYGDNFKLLVLENLLPNVNLPPFYRETSIFNGKINDKEIIGKWKCAPFETRDDFEGVVEGDWYTIPL